MVSIEFLLVIFIAAVANKALIPHRRVGGSKVTCVLRMLMTSLEYKKPLVVAYPGSLEHHGVGDSRGGHHPRLRGTWDVGVPDMTARRGRG